MGKRRGRGRSRGGNGENGNKDRSTEEGSALQAATGEGPEAQKESSLINDSGESLEPIESQEANSQIPNMLGLESQQVEPILPSVPSVAFQSETTEPQSTTTSLANPTSALTSMVPPAQVQSSISSPTHQILTAVTISKPTISSATGVANNWRSIEDKLRDSLFSENQNAKTSSENKAATRTINSNPEASQDIPGPTRGVEELEGPVKTSLSLPAYCNSPKSAANLEELTGAVSFEGEEEAESARLEEVTVVVGGPSSPAHSETSSRHSNSSAATPSAPFQIEVSSHSSLDDNGGREDKEDAAIRDYDQTLNFTSISSGSYQNTDAVPEAGREGIPEETKIFSHVPSINQAPDSLQFTPKSPLVRGDPDPDQPGLNINAPLPVGRGIQALNQLGQSSYSPGLGNLPPIHPASRFSLSESSRERSNDWDDNSSATSEFSLEGDLKLAIPDLDLPNNGQLLHYPRPPPKFYEGPSTQSPPSVPDNSPVGTHNTDVSIHVHPALTVGSEPPLARSVRWPENLEAHGWLVEQEKREADEVKAGGQVEATQDDISLEKKRRELLKLDKQLPEDILSWRLYVAGNADEIDDINELVRVANAAINAGLQLGSSQTATILELQSQNNRLREIISVSEGRSPMIGIDVLTTDEAKKVRLEAHRQAARHIETVENLRTQLRCLEIIRTGKRGRTKPVGRNSQPVTNQGEQSDSKLLSLQRWERIRQLLEALEKSESSNQETRKISHTLGMMVDDAIKWCLEMELKLQNKETRLETLSGSIDANLPEKEAWERVAEKEGELDASRSKVELLKDEVEALTARSEELAKERDEAINFMMENNRFEAEGGVLYENSSFTRCVDPAALTQGSLPLADDPKSSLLATTAMELAILRARLALSEMTRQRSQHGMRPEDNVLAIESAQDALHIAEANRNGVIVAQANFWLGVSFYYGDDVHNAQCSFKNASTDSLPEYESGLLSGWVDRCDGGGPEQYAAAYREGAIVGQESPEVSPRRPGAQLTPKHGKPGESASRKWKQKNLQLGAASNETNLGQGSS